MALSPIVEHLTASEQQRYREKIEIVRGDPYLLPARLFHPVHGRPRPGAGLSDAPVTPLPDIQYADIYNYLIDRRSVYTSETLKAFKSLEAYKYFVAGFVFVFDVQITKAAVNTSVVISKVGST